MRDFVYERQLPDCCRRSYREPNGSYHETREGEAEFCCLYCGADWTVEFDATFESDDAEGEAS